VDDRLTIRTLAPADHGDDAVIVRIPVSKVVMIDAERTALGWTGLV